MRAGLVLVLAGCGRIAFDPGTDAARDASPDALPPWSSPVVVSELSSTSLDDDPSLTDDELELYFNSTRAGGMGLGDLYVATRANQSDAFSAITNVAVVNTPENETTPEVSGDGLTLYFSSSRAGGAGQGDIYLTTRATRADAWSAPLLIAEVSSAYLDESPVVDATGTTMYFDSDRLSSGIDKLFTATRPDAGAMWSSPQLRADLDGPGEEENPFAERDGLTMWLSVDPGSGFDIYVATRATTTDSFAPYVPVTELNTSSGELDPWISVDGRTVYFSSGRTGNFEIFRATR